MINFLSIVSTNISAAASVANRLSNDSFIDSVARAADLITTVLRADGKLLLAGNGGSAADAQHIAAELVGRYKVERHALSAIALTTDGSVLTAWSNDYNYETVFARQVEAHGRAGDVFLGISTSGKSPNIIAAAQRAKLLGMHVIILTGDRDSELKKLSDVCIQTPSADTPRIQEGHIIAYHALCDCLDYAFSITDTSATLG